MGLFDWLLRRKPRTRRLAISQSGDASAEIRATKAAIDAVAAGEGPAAGRFPKLADAAPEVLTQTPTSATVAKDGPAPAVNIWDMDGDAPPAAPSRAEPRGDGRRSSRTKTRVLGFEPQLASVEPLLDQGRMDVLTDLGEPGAKATMVMHPTGWLVITAGPGRGAAFPLSQGVSQIGRGSDQTVALDFGDMAISRQNHAAIAYDPATHLFHIGHGGKSNLVRLNGKPLLSTEVLGDGDVIQIGE
ncbi:MAG: FHA domain-containing protein, partial [Paracoccaceae bacterium]|nr:FHA domain-containing protein [Paracoccaceae bacterium]